MSVHAIERPSSRAVTAAFAVALVSAMLLARPAAAATSGPVGLGTARSFAVLAGAGITNTGPTTISGNVGTFPTTTRTGFGSVTLHGTDHGGDSVTQGAKTALVTAYNDAAGRTPATPTAVELGTRTLTAGVYKSGTFGLTGTLRLDAAGDPHAQFVFQAASTLITATGSRVVLVNGASQCNVVWQVGSSATFKVGTSFVGDVLAYTSITAQTSARFAGRLLARNGAVTLDSNVISNTACATTSGTGPTATSAPAPATMTSTSTTSTTSTSTTGVPGRATGGPGTTIPALPRTGLPAWLVAGGFALLVTGCAAQAAGHRRATG